MRIIQRYTNLLLIGISLFTHIKFISINNVPVYLQVMIPEKFLHEENYPMMEVKIENRVMEWVYF